MRNVIVGRKALSDFKRGWDEGLAKYRCFDGLAVNVSRKPARLARICTRLQQAAAESTTVPALVPRQDDPYATIFAQKALFCCSLAITAKSTSAVETAAHQTEDDGLVLEPFCSDQPQVPIATDSVLGETEYHDTAEFVLLQSPGNSGNGRSAPIQKEHFQNNGLVDG